MITRSEVDGVTVLRLEHGKVNALDLELLEEITEVFTGLAGEPYRGVVLTGSGRAFSAGVDLWRVVSGGRDYVSAFLPALSAAFLAVFDLPRPVVAAVNGHAIAGGCVLACCADHRVMGSSGRVGVTELLVGVPFPATALGILSWAVGPGARSLVLGGETYAAERAVELGLVDSLADDPVAAAIGLAGRMASSIPEDTFAFTKRQLRGGVERVLSEPQVLELWYDRVQDGTIERYMRSLTRG
ncbi:MAG: enoyl-CoA hydratase/isomerase family protein [Nonomuraea sp.]|nr:enoyl-CoA hydratase/isomerase family protein [Nonomuraea sp.]